MISPIDRIYAWLYGAADETDDRWHCHEVRMTDEPIVWIVALPWRTSITLAKKYTLIPQRGTAYVYETPPAFVNPNPKEVLRIHKEITDDMMRRFENDARDIHVVAFSAGNAFGSFAANHLPAKTFLAIVTGYGLGDEVWGSIITREIKKESMELGYRTAQEYNDVLGSCKPICQTKNMPAKTEVWLGLIDAHVPVSNGLKMLREIRKTNKKARVRWFFAGHILTVFIFGLLNRWKLVRAIYS